MATLLFSCCSSVSFLLVVSAVMAVPIRFDYRDALEKSLLFFEAQRSGELPANRRVKWRGDSGLGDGLLQGVDLVGGYYDAGDHIKFGFPMAFAVTMLSWGVAEFERGIANCNQLEQALEAIRWGTDYFVKAHAEPDVLWGQVGDGDSDHSCWERPEDMSTPRTAYRLDKEHPGSDIAGETAAAMAAASIAFRPYNLTYSDLLVSHAKQLFSFANNFRGQYDDSITNVRAYYPSLTGYNDELLWAAAWLFRATNEYYYLDFLVENVVAMDRSIFVVKEFSWDNKYEGLQILIVKDLMESGTVNDTSNSLLKQCKANIELFLCSCLQKNDQGNIGMTPGGLLYFNKWSNMQYVSSSTFLLSVYSKYLSMSNANLSCKAGQIHPSEVLNFARSQADYILGKNPNSMSYLVGYRGKYPTHVHHRGASIPSLIELAYPKRCVEGFKKWYVHKESNPNDITGALVGGPNQNDGFFDQRSNYENNEPSIAGNAPLIGLFASLESSGILQDCTPTHLTTNDE